MKKYKRNCDICKVFYTGYGKKYCSHACSSITKKGKKFTEEHKKRISISNKGRIISMEQRKKISNKLKGGHQTEETKKKISKSLLGNKRSVGRIVSEETRKKLSEKGKGRIHTPETRKKISEINKGQGLGRIIPKEIRIKMGKKGALHPFWGTHRSVETKEKIANTRKQRQIGCGTTNGNWKGGITELKVRIRSSLEYAKKRKEVFMRDRYTCQECGDNKGGNLEMHHKKPFSLIFKENNLKTFEEALQCEELWNPNNGQTLCISCHKKTDTYGKPKRKDKLVTMV